MQITRRIDHVAWMVRPENHDAAVEKLSKLFDVTFEADDGGPDFGLRITWSWSAGLEVLSPCGDRAIPHCDMGWKFIETKGEGLFAVVFGVDDVEATIERARSLGYDPSPLLSLPETDKPWRKRVQECTESVMEYWLDGNLAIGRIITDEGGPQV
ncbi:MAG: hypothetical protein KDE55_01855 [Novosphingobium sp.]|nr:hypothetical protein [Novosphingobium sp.]